jgi:hypothetical protein
VPEGEHRRVKGGKWGFIDRHGVLVIPLQFSEAGSFENGRARVRTGNVCYTSAGTGGPRLEAAPPAPVTLNDNVPEWLSVHLFQHPYGRVYQHFARSFRATEEITS